MLEGKQLDKTTPVPLYYQLKMLILDEIKSGEYKPNDILPTELELGEMFGISRTTVRQAVTELVHEGYLYRIKSKGTFISDPKIQQNSSPYQSESFHSHTIEDDIASFGRNPRTELIRLAEMDTPRELKSLGYQSASGKVVFVYRCHFADDVALARVMTYMNYDKFSFLMDRDNHDLENHTMKEIMNRAEDTRIAKLVRTFNALIAGQEDIDLLKVRKGSAIQHIQNIRYNLHGEFLDMSNAYYRGDSYSLQDVSILNPAYDGR